MAFVQIDGGGNVTGAYGCAQNDPTPPGYAEIPDDDPRIAAWQARLATPRSVSMAQARIALIRSSLFDAADAAVNATGVNGETWMWWHYATIVERQNAHVLAVAAALGLTSGQIDALFQTAATIV